MILINLQLPGSAKNLKNLLPWDLFKSPAICARAPSLPFHVSTRLVVLQNFSRGNYSFFRLFVALFT